MVRGRELTIFECCYQRAPSGDKETNVVGWEQKKKKKTCSDLDKKLAPVFFADVTFTQHIAHTRTTKGIFSLPLLIHIPPLTHHMLLSSPEPDKNKIKCLDYFLFFFFFPVSFFTFQMLRGRTRKRKREKSVRSEGDLKREKSAREEGELKGE